MNCYQGGHQLSNSFLRKLMESKKAFVEIELDDIKLPKNAEVNQLIKLAVNA